MIRSKHNIYLKKYKIQLYIDLNLQVRVSNLDLIGNSVRIRDCPRNCKCERKRNTTASI